MRKYKVKIKASFDYDVVVEAADESIAKCMAAEELVYYLDVTLRNTKEFNYFQEYLLKEEMISVEEV